MTKLDELLKRFSQLEHEVAMMRRDQPSGAIQAMLKAEYERSHATDVRLNEHVAMEAAAQGYTRGLQEAMMGNSVPMTAAQNSMCTNTANDKPIKPCPVCGTDIYTAPGAGWMSTIHVCSSNCAGQIKSQAALNPPPFDRDAWIAQTREPHIKQHVTPMPDVDDGTAEETGRMNDCQDEYETAQVTPHPQTKAERRMADLTNEAGHLRATVAAFKARENFMRNEIATYLASGSATKWSMSLLIQRATTLYPTTDL